MAKGMYSSGLSAYQRRVMGLPADNCGPETIPHEKAKAKPVKVEAVEEVAEVVEVKVEAKAEKKADKKAGKKSTKDKIKDKLKGK